MKKHFLLFAGLAAVCGCVMDRVPDDKIPLQLETSVDSDLLILKTEDIRVVDVKEKRISYEYNDLNIRLSQLGDHARRFCEGRGRDTILTDMKLTNRHNFRRVTFECRDKPVLIPIY